MNSLPNEVLLEILSFCFPSYAPYLVCSLWYNLYKHIKPILYPYQKEAIKWMKEREESDVKGGILSFSMGMGKSLTSLLFCILQRRRNKEKFPTLFVMSKSLISEWKQECVEKFFHDLKVIYLHKDFCHLNSVTGRQIKRCDIVLTTYDVCSAASKEGDFDELIKVREEFGLFKDKVIDYKDRLRPKYNSKVLGSKNIYTFPWERIVCDESQRFANRMTKSFTSVLAIYAKKRWCLTGTPIRNRDRDLWSQLRFCGCDIHYRSWNSVVFNAMSCKDLIFETNYEKEGIKMPKLNEDKILLQMSENQKQLYITGLNLLKEELRAFGVNGDFSQVLTLFLRLRQIALAPYLLSQGEGWVSNKQSAGLESPKIKAIVERVPQIEGQVIVFSMFTSALKLLEEALKGLVTMDKFVGETKNRKEILDNFRTGKTKVLLCNYKVAGEGLNLQNANNVICLEPWWSPSVHAQAISRCWRRGQKREVNVYWFLIKDSIEEKILDLCNYKQCLSDHFLHGKPMPKKVGLTVAAIQRMIE